VGGEGGGRHTDKADRCSSITDIYYADEREDQCPIMQTWRRLILSYRMQGPSSLKH
jgi:hypothetical protein